MGGINRAQGGPGHTDLGSGGNKQSGEGRRKILSAAAWLLLLAASAALLFAPGPLAIAQSAGQVEITWEEGALEAVSCSEAFNLLSGCTQEELLFEREGRRGHIAGSEGYRAAYEMLIHGTLAERLRFGFLGLSPMERMALYRKFGDVCYFSGTSFAFEGDRFVKTRRSSFSYFALMDGTATSEQVRATGAKTLLLSGNAEVGGALVDTDINTLLAQPPYLAEGGCLYLDTPGGRRLVSALPHSSSLVVEQMDFCDEGALLGCRELGQLSLPFVGSAKSPLGSDYVCSLQYMFGGPPPQTLKKIEVTGGEILPFAFSGCEYVEEIDLCKLEQGALSPDAFGGCTSLEKLHTSAQNLHLPGEFTATLLPCGCYLYQRKGGRA